MRKLLFVLAFLVFVIFSCKKRKPAPAMPVLSAEEINANWNPSGEVELIVPYREGNITDLQTRLLVKYANKYMKAKILVKNIDGASGYVGWEYLSKAKADGTVLGVVTLPDLSYLISCGLSRYYFSGFVPVCTFFSDPAVLVIRRNDHRFVSLEGFVKFARTNDDSLIASTNGVQSSAHLGAKLFANSAGFKFVDQPCRNVSDEILALEHFQADFCVVKVSDLVGKLEVLKPLAVFSSSRVAFPGFEGVPTFVEKGYCDDWVGFAGCICAPSGLSASAVSFFEKVFEKAVNDPGYIEESSYFYTDFMKSSETFNFMEKEQRLAYRLNDAFWK